MSIKLNGILIVPDSEIALVEKYLPDHIALSRAEDGCISFNVKPDPKNPNHYIVKEEFVDQAAFDFHQKRGKDSAWGRATSHLERQFNIEAT